MEGMMAGEGAPEEGLDLGIGGERVLFVFLEFYYWLQMSLCFFFFCLFLESEDEELTLVGGEIEALHFDLELNLDMEI